MLKLAYISAFFVLGLFCYLAAIEHDPHWVQRGGALLTAIAAFMAIYEASIEHDLRIFEATRANENDGPLTGLYGTSSQLVNRVKNAKFRFKHSGLSASKLRAVFWISILAVFGEILHGFGDIIYETALSIVEACLETVVSFLQTL